MEQLIFPIARLEGNEDGSIIVKMIKPREKTSENGEFRLDYNGVYKLEDEDDFR